MSKGQKPDPRRKKTSTPTATYWKVPNGGKETGYMAGECYGCYGHRVNHHKPCLKELTGGELSCPWCGVVEIEWRGYVPVWDQDWTLKYALIPEDYLESVDMIPHRARIIGSRGAAKMSPLVIRAAEVPALRPLPEKSPYRDPIDMFAICRKLWKLPALDAWYASTHARDAGAVAGAPPLNLADFGGMTRAAAARLNERDGQAAVNQEFVEAVRRGALPPDPKPNGKPKPKG